MPVLPSPANGAKASHSRSRSGPHNHLPIPIIGRDSKPLIMVVESPALVLALLSKGHKPKAKSRGLNPVIPEAASYMNHCMTKDDLFITYITNHSVPLCTRYRMKSVTELKSTSSRQRSSNVLDRFERIRKSSRLSSASTHAIQSTQALYERALEQNMQIFPTATHALTHRNHHQHQVPTINKNNKISPSGTDLANSIHQTAISKHDPLSQFLHRATSSPLILYAAPLDHLFILQLYRLSHLSFHDKTTSLNTQAERAASLLDLIRRQNGKHIDDGSLDVQWALDTAQKVVASTMWSDRERDAEDDRAWIVDNGERGLRAVFGVVEERLYELESSEE